MHHQQTIIYFSLQRPSAFQLAAFIHPFSMLLC